MSDSFIKDPSAVKPFRVVFASLSTGTNDGSATDTGELQGETLSSVSWTVPSGITEDSNNTDAVTIKGVSYDVDTVATIWLSGGTAATDYQIICRAVTSGGRTLDDHVITIMVRDVTY